jgi:hypothetical protein
MSAAATRLLELLPGAKQTGPGRWITRCPAHEDRSPSLSIRDIDDRVLLHDFGGCDTSAVLAALGLSLSDLFEKPLGPHVRPAGPRIPATDVLVALDHELTVAVLLLEDATGRTLDEQEQARLALAVSRIKSGITYARALR